VQVSQQAARGLIGSYHVAYMAGGAVAVLGAIAALRVEPAARFRR